MVTSVHETVVRDIIDIAQGIKDTDEVKQITNRQNGTSFKSITSKTEALTMVFPVICSRNMSYETAAMISKAIERKAVSMLHMLFTACNITDAQDGIDYLSRFHTNLKTGNLSVDDFISALDDFVEENSLITNYNDMDSYKKICEDMRAMNFYFENNINDQSINDYKVVNVNETKLLVNTYEPVTEAPRPGAIQLPDHPLDILATYRRMMGDMTPPTLNDLYDPMNTGRPSQEYSAAMDHWRNLSQVERDRETAYRNDRGEEDERQREARRRREKAADHFIKRQELDLKRDQLGIERDKAHWSARQTASSINKNNMDLAKNRLVDQDIKKANELTPTLMYVNFIQKDSNSDYPIYSSLVVGVKAKLYTVDGEDILNRLKIKNSDRHLLLNLIRVSTREISFFKDFLLAVDRAKLDALSQSRRGSSNKLWKLLERRALKSKIRRSLSSVNDATAISTLCITQDEVEFLKKTEYIDVENPRIIRPIMDAYNLMGFCIADESLEICKFIFDTGEDVYETLTYTNLEKESKDNTKKIINLMSKMNR